MSDTNQIINEAAEILIEAKDKVTALLQKLPQANLSLAVGPKIQAVINNLFFLSGSVQPQRFHEVVDPFPPVTNFMGEEIKLPKQVNAEDLSPNEMERTLFVDKVERLYAELSSIPVDGVLNAYTIPEDKLVLRGVAKKAGLPNYEDREINASFIEDTVKYIKEKSFDDQKQIEIDDAVRREQMDEIEKQKNLHVSTNLDNSEGEDNEEEYDDEDLYDHVVTEEDMERNPEMSVQGVKVGDTIQLPVQDRFTASRIQAADTKSVFNQNQFVSNDESRNLNITGSNNTIAPTTTETPSTVEPGPTAPKTGTEEVDNTTVKDIPQEPDTIPIGKPKDDGSRPGIIEEGKDLSSTNITDQSKKTSTEKKGGRSK